MRRQYSAPSVHLAKDILASGRTVEVVFDRNTGEIVVWVFITEHPLFLRSARLPMHSFPLFGRPLSERIRSTVQELDDALSQGHEDEEIVSVREAAEAALYHGGPREEGANYVRQEPPLVLRIPPDPPPAPRAPASASVGVREGSSRIPRRAPERGVKEGREVQPPPDRPPPVSPPSE